MLWNHHDYEAGACCSPPGLTFRILKSVDIKALIDDPNLYDIDEMMIYVRGNKGLDIRFIIFNLLRLFLLIYAHFAGELNTRLSELDS
jgi:hypothetical protein